MDKKLIILTPIKAGFHDLIIEGDNINVRSKTLYAEYGLFTTWAYFARNKDVGGWSSQRLFLICQGDLAIQWHTL